MSIRIFENILAYRRTRDGYAFTVIKIEISQNCPRHGKCCACVAYHRDHNEGGAVIRFAPIDIDKQQYASVHGENENISVEKIHLAVDFYRELIGKYK